MRNADIAAQHPELYRWGRRAWGGEGDGAGVLFRLRQGPPAPIAPRTAHPPPPPPSVWRDAPERFALDGRYPVRDAFAQARRAWAGAGGARVLAACC